MITLEEKLRLKNFQLQLQTIGSNNIVDSEKQWVLSVIRREQIPVDKIILAQIREEGLSVDGIKVEQC